MSLKAACRDLKPPLPPPYPGLSRGPTPLYTHLEPLFLAGHLHTRQGLCLQPPERLSGQGPHGLGAACLALCLAPACGASRVARLAAEI